MTTTYVKLPLSAAAYEEIEEKLRRAGYDHAFLEDGDIWMEGIAVCREEVIKHHHSVPLELAEEAKARFLKG